MIPLFLALLTLPQGDFFVEDIFQVDYENADVGQVLKFLFKGVNAQYRIDPDVHGTITLHLKKTPYPEVLKKILTQAHAYSVFEDQVFYVEHGPEPPAESKILARRLPTFDFIKTNNFEAIKEVFKAAKVESKLGNFYWEKVGRKLPSGTLKEDLDLIFSNRNLAYRYVRGYFEVNEEPPKIQDDLLDTILPEVEFFNVDVREALRQLLKKTGANYTVDPEIQGKLMLRLTNVSYEQAIQFICTSVHATYSYRNKTFFFTRQRMEGDPAPDYDATTFVPAGYTSRIEITNGKLFLSPRRTKGGTFDLLSEAFNLAGLHDLNLSKFGSNGFATILPFESIDKSGMPVDRFVFKPRFLWEFGTDNLVKYFNDSQENRNHDFRLIILAVDDGATPNSKAPSVYRGNWISFQYRNEKWTKTPRLTAYIYEFRRQGGNSLAVLLKPGQSLISAKKHLASAGLWHL